MASTSLANQTTPKSSKKTATAMTTAKTSKSLATHPPTSDMVQHALKTLDERGGSSLPAIKKFIAGTYKLDSDGYAHHIRKYLVTAVDAGKLVRTKGKGAAGSFKLAPQEKPRKKKEVKPQPDAKKEVKPAAAKKKVVKSATAVAAKTDEEAPKKSVKGVKSAAASKKNRISVSKLKAKTPVKARTTKNAIRKVKTPKPKKAAA